MPVDEQNSDSNTSSPAWAGSWGTAQSVITAVSTIAVAYGAYKVLGGIFNARSAALLFDPLYLSHWKDLGPNRELIHVVQTRYLSSSPLFKTAAENVFKDWDIISASLVDASLVATSGGAERYTGLGGAVGLILEAAPQNILGTHPHDVSFSNHSRGWGLVGDFLSGSSKSPENPLKYPHYNRLMTPDDLLNRRNEGMLNTAFGGPDYNEVLLAAKGHIRIYEGYPATEYLKIKGVVLIPCAGSGKATDEEMKAAKQLKKVNPNLPVYGVVKRQFSVVIA